MTSFLGRPAWRIDTQDLRVTVLECGGHVAEMVYKPVGELNPLWIQNVPTIDSDLFDPEMHGSVYGTDGEAKLVSGLAGHNLCFPYWGLASEAEQAAGMTAHGETNIVRWKECGSGQNWLHLYALLPECGIRFERTIRCEGQVVYFAESAENLSAWDRPIAWCQHVTLGPGFLNAANTKFHASLTRGFRTSGNPRQEFSWPEGCGEIRCCLTSFSKERHSDLVNSFLVDPAREHGHFVSWNTEERLLLGYVFRRSEFPWMNVWECNNTSRQTRGMEFSTTPIEGTMRALAASSQIWDVPVYEWLPAKGRIKKSYAAFLIEIDRSFSAVSDVRVSPGALELFASSGESVIRISGFNSGVPDSN